MSITVWRLNRLFPLLLYETHVTKGNCVSELMEVSGKGGGTALHLTLLTVLLICQQQMALLLQIARKLVYCKVERPGGRRREQGGEEKGKFVTSFLFIKPSAL